MTDLKSASDFCVHGRWIPRGCDDCCAEVLELRRRIRLARRYLRTSTSGLDTDTALRVLHLRDLLPKRRG